EPRPVPMAPGLGYNWGTFFPDGKRLLFLASRAGEPLKYGWQPIDGNDFHAIADAPGGAYQGAAAISPDGKTIAARAFNSDLRLTPIDGGSPRSLPSPFGKQNWRPVRYSSDGRRLYVYRATELDSPAEVRLVE